MNSLEPTPSVGVFEIERCRVDAIAESAGLRSVVEDMAQMGTAAAAEHLLPKHTVTIVDGCPHSVSGERQVETGPPRSGIEFLPGSEQFRTADDTAIGTIGLVVHVTPTERYLRTLQLRDPVLLVGQPLA